MMEPVANTYKLLQIRVYVAGNFVTLHGTIQIF